MSSKFDDVVIHTVKSTHSHAKIPTNLCIYEQPMVFVEWNGACKEMWSKSLIGIWGPFLLTLRFPMLVRKWKVYGILPKSCSYFFAYWILLFVYLSEDWRCIRFCFSASVCVVNFGGARSMERQPNISLCNVTLKYNRRISEIYV